MNFELRTKIRQAIWKVRYPDDIRTPPASVDDYTDAVMSFIEADHKDTTQTQPIVTN